MPVRPLPDPEAERRRRGRQLADRRRAEPEQPAAHRRRLRAPTLRVAGEQAREAAAVQVGPHLREQRCGAGDGRGGGARPVDGSVQRRLVGRRSRLGGRDRDAGRGDVRLQRPVVRETLRREPGDDPAVGVRRFVHSADRDADVEPGALRGEQLHRSRRRDDDRRSRRAFREPQATRPGATSRRERRQPRPRATPTRRSPRDRRRPAARPPCPRRCSTRAGRRSRSAPRRGRPRSPAARRRGGSPHAPERPRRAAARARRG